MFVTATLFIKLYCFLNHLFILQNKLHCIHVKVIKLFICLSFISTLFTFIVKLYDNRFDLEVNSFIKQEPSGFIILLKVNNGYENAIVFTFFILICY